MEVIRLRRDEPVYPSRLPQFLGNDAPTFLDALGNLELLRCRLLSFFASVRCPGRFILQAHDLAQDLRRAGIPTIGGFHSPVEREVLTVLLRGEQPIVVCPARSLARMRIPKEYHAALEAGRMLLLSPFDERTRRATFQTAQRRNRLVAALAEWVFVAYAAPGGKTEAFCEEINGWGQPLYTLEGNENLIQMGATGITAQSAALFLDPQSTN
jgi:predicted Rossmann fold nucleotide-binding protein DprA/Smf involved in DNA uptake